MRYQRAHESTRAWIKEAYSRGDEPVGRPKKWQGQDPSSLCIWSSGTKREKGTSATSTECLGEMHWHSPQRTSRTPRCTSKALHYHKATTSTLRRNIKSEQLKHSQLPLMRNRAPTLMLVLLDLGLQIPRLVRLSDFRPPTLPNHNPRTVRKQIIHLLERPLRRLR